ncbi:hypothetical protein ABPG72_006251 [Tetrahymena utriculariae]
MENQQQTEQKETQVLKEIQTDTQEKSETKTEKVEAQKQRLSESESKAEDHSVLLSKSHQYLNRRVECQSFYGTIKYSGPLIHEGRPANSENQLWFGVEWDDETRGRHNGTVKGTQYFVTKDNKNSGTLVKYEKVSIGIDILDGILAKYFKENIPQNLKLQIQNQVDRKYNKQVLKTEVENLPDSVQQEINSEKLKEEEEQKRGEDQIKKVIQVEMDEEAYFETFKKHKKMVQFYGFDKIWNRLNNITELTEISLQEVCISDLGHSNYLRRLLPNLKTLSLEKNLLFDWDQVFQIGYELEILESLSITSNKLMPLEKNVSERCCKDVEENTLMCWSNYTRIKDVTPMGVFHSLKTLIVIDCNLNWTQVSRFLPAFPSLEELFLCRNNMTDFENFTYRDEDLKNLKLLNLENTELTKIDGLKVHLNKLSKLQKLILNKNKLTQLGELEIYENITHISLESNLIEDPIIFTQLSKFPNLTYLNIKHNPIGDKCGKSYVRQRAVAECLNLSIINGSNLKKYERKDCEIFYLRRTFDDYFTLTGQVYYKYNLQQFLEWSAKEHPNHGKLLHKYGNPYEQQPEEPKNITEDTAPKNVMVQLNLIAAAGSQLGKPNKSKKFPDNTSILSLKNVLSKLYGIPNDKLILKYRVNQHDPNEILDEDHKTLGFYQIKDNTTLIVDQLD